VSTLQREGPRVLRATGTQSKKQSSPSEEAREVKVDHRQPRIPNYALNIVLEEVEETLKTLTTS
jgi:hypothetical protein